MCDSNLIAHWIFFFFKVPMVFLLISCFPEEHHKIKISKIHAVILLGTTQLVSRS